MDTDAQIAKNADDIGKLTTTVSEIAVVVKYEVERAKEDRSSVKDMVNELKSLNLKITEMAGVQKEQAQAGKDLAELKTRVDQLKEWKDKFDLSNLFTRVEGLERVRSEQKGIREAVTTGADWFWRIFGNAISAAVVGALIWGYAHSNPQANIPTVKHHAVITGE